MIESLDIENLGVIESSHVDFGPRFTVLTGETGAGKTMVLTSLNLLLGGRADPQIVRQSSDESASDRGSVDGVFSVPRSMTTCSMFRGQSRGTGDRVLPLEGARCRQLRSRGSLVHWSLFMDNQISFVFVRRALNEKLWIPTVETSTRN